MLKKNAEKLLVLLLLSYITGYKYLPHFDPAYQASPVHPSAN